MWGVEGGIEEEGKQVLSSSKMSLVFPNVEGEACGMRTSYVCGELREELGRRGHKC